MCDTGELSIADLMKGLGDAKSKLGPARKALMKMAKQAEPLATPLPGPIRERQERKAGYETTKEDITKWQPLVKVPCPHSISLIHVTVTLTVLMCCADPQCPDASPLVHYPYCITSHASPLLQGASATFMLQSAWVYFSFNIVRASITAC